VTAGEDDYDFLGLVDGTTLDINGGRVTILGTVQNVSALTNIDATDENDYWVEAQLSIASALEFSVDIDSTISEGTFPAAYDEGTSGDITCAYYIGSWDGTFWDQGHVGSIADPFADPGTLAALTDISTLEYMAEMDDNTEGEINLVYNSMEFDFVRGLTYTATEDTETKTDTITATNPINIEVGANIVHVNELADWGTLSLDMSAETVSFGGASDSAADIDIGRVGHIKSITIDGTTFTNPDPEENYKYRDCEGGQPDIIIDELHDFISSGDTCYEFFANTQQPVTGQTLDATYASCESCLTDNTNDLWVDCTDEDTTLAVFGDVGPGFDYAWLCIGGVYVKAKALTLTTFPLDVKTYLEQCGGAFSCEDLVGWPAEDAFDGVDCNSGSVGDTNWDIIWSESSDGGTTTIPSSGKVRFTCNTVNPSNEQQTNNGEASGDFTIIWKIDMVTYSSNTTISQQSSLKLLDSGSNFIAQIGINKFDGDDATKWQISVDNPGFNQIATDYPNDTVYFRAVRSGTTISFDYSSNGSSWTSTGATRTSSANIRPDINAFSRWTGGNLVVEVSGLNFTGVANIDPTGDTCT
jgi:hypothetical protein